MESAAKKLNSSRGASIILALVFLLVCVMVGSSVLMAAASNAGRSRSNRQEQQLYLVLSSALQLVADDLTGVEYTSQMQCERTTPEEERPGYIVYELRPQDGEMVRPDESEPMFADVFCPALDSISDGNIKDILEREYPEDPTAGEADGDHYSYSAYVSEPEPQSFTLTVTAADGPLAEYEAQVDVTVGTNYRITLTARMTGAPDEEGEALELVKNYYLTTTLTRSGGITSTSLTIPTMEANGERTITAGAITWKAGKVLREYREAGP